MQGPGMNPASGNSVLNDLLAGLAQAVQAQQQQANKGFQIPPNLQPELHKSISEADLKASELQLRNALVNLGPKEMEAAAFEMSSTVEAQAVKELVTMFLPIPRINFLLADALQKEPSPESIQKLDQIAASLTSFDNMVKANAKQRFAAIAKSPETAQSPLDKALVLSINIAKESGQTINDDNINTLVDRAAMLYITEAMLTNPHKFNVQRDPMEQFLAFLLLTGYKMAKSSDNAQHSEVIKSLYRPIRGLVQDAQSVFGEAQQAGQKAMLGVLEAKAPSLMEKLGQVFKQMPQNMAAYSAMLQKLFTQNGPGAN